MGGLTNYVIEEASGAAHAERAVGSAFVVVLDPPGDDDLGFEQGVELLAVEALAAHAAVAPFGETVLLRAAFLDERRGHSLLAEPEHQGVGDELSAVVTADDLW